jgi:hypothetical protein
MKTLLAVSLLCSIASFASPDKWESFTAVVVNERNVLLKWEASSEINSPVFQVEHSIDGVEWIVIYTLQLNSDLGSLAKGSFTHVNPGPGTHQYRVRQIGVTGRPSFSDINVVTIKKSNNLVMWPIPAKDVINVQSELDNNSNTATYAKLFNHAGNLVKQFELKPGTNTIDVSSLKPDLYIIQTQLPGGEMHNQKIIKQ